jgi:peptidoglycan LD-endopeptidase LytH
MTHRSCRALLFAATCFIATHLFAQTPFQFPTANHALYEPGAELKFLAPTAPDKPWTSGSYGCVRDNSSRMHEGLDIRSLQRDRHGEPTDPVMATADGTVMYINAKAGLSNYGRYIVIRHMVEGLEIYSLYAHLSAPLPGLKAGDPVRAGQVIATMGRTSSTEFIAKDRAHCHFELNVLVNDNFTTWFKKNSPGERNDHGEWNGQNLLGLDPRLILLGEHDPVKKFSLLDFVRGQTELCRVLVRATNFPYLKRYSELVLRNPIAEKQGVAGYEIALNYNAVPFALMPRAVSEIKGTAKFQLLSVNVPVELANPCRHLVAQSGSHWRLTDKGMEALNMLVY